jgi:hypothetical protein
MKKDNVINTVCGSLSGLMSDAIVFPLDTVKTRIIMEKNKLNNTSATKTLFNIIKNEGFISLFKGLNFILLKVFLQVN